jgi:hypothetical protein
LHHFTDQNKCNYRVQNTTKTEKMKRREKVTFS